jgi:hypothetical protein
LWTKQLGALLRTPWNTKTTQSLGLEKGARGPTTEEKKANAMAGKSQRSITTTAKTKTKAKVARMMVAATKKNAPVMTERLMAKSTEMPMPGITDVPLHRNRAA